MADESLHVPISDQNIDFHIVTLFERLEAMRKDNGNYVQSGIGARLSSVVMQPKKSMQAEIRTLEFWRSIIAECLASFFYVFIVCGAAAGAGVGASVSSVLLATALASGFAIATLTQCFLHISGAHINPAVTMAACVIRAISPLRAAMYMTAQCGGGIAGAALLYGVTVPGYQGNLQAAISHSSSLAAWERFGVEFILTFIIVLSYFVSMDSYKKYLGNASLAVGAAYSACSFVSMPYLNPARSLGPSFVLNKWDHHWVYWFGPLVGGALSGIVYEYIFNSRRNAKKSKDNLENDSSSVHSEDDLNYDLDIEKPNIQNQKFHGTTYRAPATGTINQQNGYCQNFYTTTPLTKIEQTEPLYGGTRSLYCRSPPLTRANLNRSQSVYAKSNTAINRDIVPRPGPLVPAQSLYPIRVTQAQNSHLQNQNVQNQLQQRSESIYGVRESTRQQSEFQQQQRQQHQQQQLQQQQQQHHQPLQQCTSETIGFQPVYGSRHNPTPQDGGLKYDQRSCDSRDDTVKFSRTNRPESAYGTTGQRGRGQSAQSDDSSYGSYHGSAITPPARNPSNGVVVGSGGDVMMYAPPSNQGVIRSNTERKLSSNAGGIVGSSCQQVGERQQTVTYSTKPPQIVTNGQPPPPPQQSVVQHSYGMMPMRPN